VDLRTQAEAEGLQVLELDVADGVRTS